MSADIAILLVRGLRDMGGIAYIGPARSMVGVVDYDQETATGMRTFSHEVGHILGTIVFFSFHSFNSLDQINVLSKYTISQKIKPDI